VKVGTWTPAVTTEATLYRLLRPLSICTLIERKMNAADFSVDPQTIALLKFEVGAYRMLTNRDPLPYYDKIDWATQTQHVFRDDLRRASTALIKEDSDHGLAVMDYSEFLAAFPDPVSDVRLAPLAAILKHTGASVAESPLLGSCRRLCVSVPAVHFYLRPGHGIHRQGPRRQRTRCHHKRRRVPGA
jgi:hypothetical protein